VSLIVLTFLDRLYIWSFCQKFKGQTSGLAHVDGTHDTASLSVPHWRFSNYHFLCIWLPNYCYQNHTNNGNFISVRMVLRVWETVRAMSLGPERGPGGGGDVGDDVSGGAFRETSCDVRTRGRWMSGIEMLPHACAVLKLVRLSMHCARYVFVLLAEWNVSKCNFTAYRLRGKAQRRISCL
jgi:hypothetical protein